MFFNVRCAAKTHVASLAAKGSSLSSRTNRPTFPHSGSPFPPPRHREYHPGMLIAVAIFGVVLAAFCVWLGVRIVNRRERWAKWTLTALISVPVLYVASIGPACWISSRADCGARVMTIVYQPLLKMAADVSGDDGHITWIGEFLFSYSRLFTTGTWDWNLDFDLSGNIRWIWSNPPPMPPLAV
jgi:hypothetical protein